VRRGSSSADLLVVWLYLVENLGASSLWFWWQTNLFEAFCLNRGFRRTFSRKKIVVVLSRLGAKENGKVCKTMGSDVATSSHNWQACRCPSHPLMSLMKFGTEQLPNTDRPQNLRNKCLLTSKDISRKKEEERIRKLSDKNDKEQSCLAQLRVFYDIIPSPTSCASFRIIMNHFEKLYSVETKKLVHWLNVNRLNAQLAPSPVKHASEVQLPSSDRTTGPNGIQRIGLTTKSRRHCDFFSGTIICHCVRYLQGCDPSILQVTLELLQALGEASSWCIQSTSQTKKLNFRLTLRHLVCRFQSTTTTVTCQHRPTGSTLTSWPRISSNEIFIFIRY